MDAETYRITVKDDALAVTRTGDEEEIFTFDRAGRLFAAWIAQRFYRRGLDGRGLEKHSTREDGRRIGHRRILTAQEADRLVDLAASGAAQALSQLARGEAELLWTASTAVSMGEALRLGAAAAAFYGESPPPVEGAEGAAAPLAAFRDLDDEGEVLVRRKDPHRAVHGGKSRGVPLGGFRVEGGGRGA